MNICTLFAIIGGPTVGKSAVIRYLHEWVNRDSGICVMFLDETATILLRNVDKKLLEEQNPILRQIYIFRTQKAREDELSKVAETVGIRTLVISDRGLNDIFCYCTPEEADQYFTAGELALLHNHYNIVLFVYNLLFYNVQLFYKKYILSYCQDSDNILIHMLNILH